VKKFLNARQSDILAVETLFITTKSRYNYELERQSRKTTQIMIIEYNSKAHKNNLIFCKQKAVDHLLQT
jgi:hypothetical protein